MVDRKRHPNKEIEAALRYAESYGWRVIASGHHAWGKLYCPQILRHAGVGNFV